MQIGRYQIIDDIGAGGMGRVRLARDERDPSGRLVVLKTAIHDDEDDDERLRDEARVGLRVRHKYLVETIECFDVRDRFGRCRPVLVTAYVPGVSALELRRLGPLPPTVVCRLGRQLAEGLHALHEARDDEGRKLGILHRDVTAGNCMLGHDGTGRVIDLGIARFAESRALRTETGLLRGTLRYLAPELFDGGAYSVQTDLWALGVVLWEALLGRTAVVGSDAVAVSRICAGRLMILDDHERPDTLASRAVGALLKKNPADRPKTAQEAAALFAMVEKTLERGLPAGRTVDTVVSEVVAAAIAGTSLIPEAPREVSLGTAEVQQLTVRGDDETGLMAPTELPMLEPRTPSGRFRDDPRWPPPVPLTGEIATTLSHEAVVALLPSRFTPPPSTPSQGLRDYAEHLQEMELAHAEAWRRGDAERQQAMARLPEVHSETFTGDIFLLSELADLDDDVLPPKQPPPGFVKEGATVLLDFPGRFEMPPMTPLFTADTPEFRGLTAAFTTPEEIAAELARQRSSLALSSSSSSSSSKQVSSPTPLDPSEWDRVR